MKTITIQPRPFGVNTPRPFHINEDGTVQNQEFWSHIGIVRLVGFADKLKGNKIHILISDFLREPGKAIGKYPIFADANGEWKTQGPDIMSFTETEELPQKKKRASKKTATKKLTQK